MRQTFFKSKIHRARVTHADLDYEGSITIDDALMEAMGMPTPRTPPSAAKSRRGSPWRTRGAGNDVSGARNAIDAEG